MKAAHELEVLTLNQELTQEREKIVASAQPVEETIMVAREGMLGAAPPTGDGDKMNEEARRREEELEEKLRRTREHLEKEIELLK